MTTIRGFRMLVAFKCVLLCFLAQSYALAMAQATIRVPQDAPTIQSAIDIANSGDTVLVAPGTYNENIDFKGKGITVTSGATAYTNAGAVVLEAPVIGPAVTFHSGEPAIATLNGFVITHGPDSTGAQYMGNGIDLVGSSGTFTNNIIRGNSGCAVSAFKSPTLVLQGNQLTGQHDPIVYGAQFDCAYRDFEANLQLTPPGVGFPAVFVYWNGNVTISNNLIENNNSYGLNGIIDQYTATSLIQNNIVRNNSFAVRSGIIVAEPQTVTILQNSVYGNSTFSRPGATAYGVAEARSEIEIYETRSPYDPVRYIATATVLNNTVFKNIVTDAVDGTPQAFPEAFSLIGKFVATTVANNIFVTTQNTFPAAGCPEPDSSSTISFTNNDSFGGIPSTVPCSTTPTDRGNISLDPQFVSPATFDLHTLASSPVVASGNINASPLPPADLDAKARTVCGTIDMGVYEVRPHPPIGLSSSPNPSVGGSLVAFPIHVTGNCNVPTGTVTLLDGQQVAGTAVLDASGNAVISTAALTVGTHNMTVSYLGDFNFDQSTSNIVLQVVTGYPSSTSLQISPNPAGAFQPITLSASVTSQFGIPDGTVSFFAGGNVLATIPVSSSGVASTTLSTLGAGTYNVTAVYNASVHFASSTSVPITLVVQGAATSVSLTSTPNPSSFGQGVTFTATVTAPQSSVVPAGTVNFREGSFLLGSAAVNSSGIAAFTTSLLAVGSHTITANYAGSPNDNASTSNAIVQVVQPITTVISLAGSPNPAALGQTVTLTATASPVGNVTVPAGSITFADQFGTLGTVPLTNGQAVLTTSSLTTGTHNIIATFAATGNFAGAASPVLAELIQSFDFSMMLSPASLSLAAGKQGQVTVQLTGVGNLPGNVSLQATQIPMYATIRFSPATVLFAAGGSASSLLSIDTAQAPPHALLGMPAGRNNGSTLTFTGLLVVPLLLLRRRRFAKLFCSLLLMAGLVALSGCTNIFYPLNRVAPGTYSIPITATDTTTNITHTATLTFTVTP